MMHKQKKWLIWMSIFLSTAVLGGHTPVGTTVTAQAVSKPIVISIPRPELDLNFPIIRKPVVPEVSEPAPTTTTTVQVVVATTEPAPEVAVATEPEPVIPTGDCLGYAMSYDEAQSCWMPLLSQYDWDVQHAFRVLYRESTGKSDARNPSGASGLMQIMLPLHCHRFTDRGWSCDDWADPAKNIAVAYDLYLDAGWGPWGG